MQLLEYYSHLIDENNLIYVTVFLRPYYTVQSPQHVARELHCVAGVVSQFFLFRVALQEVELSIV